MGAKHLIKKSALARTLGTKDGDVGGSSWKQFELRTESIIRYLIVLSSWIIFIIKT